MSHRRKWRSRSRVCGPAEFQRAHTQCHPQVAPDDAGILANGVGHAADQGIAFRGGGLAKADTKLRRGSSPRRPRTHSRPTVRMGISGIIKSPQEKGERGGNTNSSWHCEQLGTSGGLLADVLCDEVPIL